MNNQPFNSSKAHYGLKANDTKERSSMPTNKEAESRRFDKKMSE